MRHDVVRDIDQHLVSGEVAILVVDGLEVIEVEHRDGAGAHLAHHEFVLLAQLAQHADAARRSGQRIEVVERILEFALNGLDFEAQALHRRDEALVVADRNGHAARRRRQQGPRVLVHALMFSADLGNAGMVSGFGHPGAIVPLAKSAIAMRVRAGVPLIRRQVTDQRRVKVLSPLLVIVDCRLQLLERGVHLFSGYVGDGHLTL